MWITEYQDILQNNNLNCLMGYESHHLNLQADRQFCVLQIVSLLSSL